MPARDDNKEKKYVLVMTSDANDDTTALTLKGSLNNKIILPCFMFRIKP